MNNLTVLGPSSDRRTNRWQVICLKCEKGFEPSTTMFFKQVVQCPKCGTKMLANYNERTLTKFDG